MCGRNLRSQRRPHQTQADSRALPPGLRPAAGGGLRRHRHFAHAPERRRFPREDAPGGREVLQYVLCRGRDPHPEIHQLAPLEQGSKEEQVRGPALFQFPAGAFPEPGGGAGRLSGSFALGCGLGFGTRSSGELL